MTLLEISIALFISVILTLMVGALLLSANGLSMDVEVATRGTSTANRALEQITTDLLPSEVLNFNETSIVFQEPVDGDGDGDYVDVNGNVQLGAEGVEGRAYEYFWVQTGTLSESGLGLDLNDDGDTADNIASGNLIRRVVNSTGTELSRRTILGNGQLIQSPGSAEIPPLFAMPTTESVEVTVCLPVRSNYRTNETSRLYQGRSLLTLR